MNMTAEKAKTYRQIFHNFNKFMLGMWMVGLGKTLNAWPEVGGRIMVLVHTGRKSGKRRRTPVNYTSVNGDIYCIAGFGAVSDWFKNIQANPQVEIWLPNGWWAGLAEEIFDPAQRLDISRKVIKASGFAGRAFGIEIDKLSNEDLDKITADYRAVRIRRTTARTGPGGPGEYAWVWQVATLLLLLRPGSRRRKR